MLALTENAVQAVKHIVAAGETAETGGLRVVAEEAGLDTSLRLTVADVPAEDDDVVEASGARIFLDPKAAALLDDKVLDARVDEDRVAFTIGDQTNL